MKKIDVNIIIVFMKILHCLNKLLLPDIIHYYYFNDKYEIKILIKKITDGIM